LIKEKTKQFVKENNPKLKEKYILKKEKKYSRAFFWY